LVFKTGRNSFAEAPYNSISFPNKECLVFEYAWFLKRQGYAVSTTMERARRIKRLTKLGVDLLSCESVKEIIAEQDRWSVNTKTTFVDAYTSFLKSIGKS